MQTNVIQYNYFSADKIIFVFTMVDVLITHPFWCGRWDSKWMLLHSTAQSHNIQTEFLKARIDGDTSTNEEYCSSNYRGLRIVLLF